MRVALDYTPAISQIAGVGRYTRSLFAALRDEAGDSAEWSLWYPADQDGEPHIPRADNVTGNRLPLTARWASMLWYRLGIPIKLERFSGPLSVVHGTDFVVPPSRAPSVVTIHDLSYAILPDLAYPRLRRYLARAVPRSIDRARKIIAVSETTKADLCEYYEIAPHRVEVIHHAADPLFHVPTEGEVLGNLAQFGLRRPYFIIVGTVEPRKDHLTLLRAFEQVHANYPKASLVIVGRKGWLADDIVRAIDDASRKMPIVHMQGIRDDMLPALYGGATALVYPSRYEGFGLPLLEAMASGTAVIASDTPALREVGAEAALYAEPEDVDAFAALMSRLLEDSETRKNLIADGQERAAGFTWQRAAQEHLRVYRELADE